MNILFVASECAPFVKTGGLADVIGALPKALGQLGHSVRILLPAYPALDTVKDGGVCVISRLDLFGGAVQLVASTAEGLDLLLLDAPHLYDRKGTIYLDEEGEDWTDNHLRFGALSQVATQVMLKGAGGWKPDLLHAHDWQAGLAPFYLEQMGADFPTVTTIHNIAFQGLFDADTRHALGIIDADFTMEKTEYWGKLSFLKAGLTSSDAITTVSPTYAQELMQPAFGMGLEGLLQHRQDDLSGILNGIDTDIWNPATDKHLVSTYTSRSFKRRGANRAALEERFGLAPQDNAPLFCVISRLTRQKGLDVLLDALPHLLYRGAQLALLGTGDRDLEEGFAAAAQKHAGQIGVEIGYDENLAHLLQGGADSIVIPSRFEPCGLTQLYGLRYGCLPLVANTGGLADTVVDATPQTLRAKTATGFVCDPGHGDSLRAALDRACDVFAQPNKWGQMRRTAMAQVVDWDNSARQYEALYRSLM
ncbi:MAG: glycogen synthase GlgA [Pseudomonadota bacterium]